MVPTSSITIDNFTVQCITKSRLSCTCSDSINTFLNNIKSSSGMPTEFTNRNCTIIISNYSSIITFIAMNNLICFYSNIRNSLSCSSGISTTIKSSKNSYLTPSTLTSNNTSLCILHNSTCRILISRIRKIRVFDDNITITIYTKSRDIMVISAKWGTCFSATITKKNSRITILNRIH